MMSVVRRQALFRAIGFLQRTPKRYSSQVINLSPEELKVTDPPAPAIKHPAKYPFEKLDFKTSIISQLMMKVKSKKMREKHQMMMLEGRRLIQEAVDAGCGTEYRRFRWLLALYLPVKSLRCWLFIYHDDLNSLNLPEGPLKIYKTPYNEIKTWSDLTTSPGLIGIFRIPSPIAESRTSVPVTVICDQLREPGNLGSMIRNCAGVGVRRVILTPGCTDLWDGKVLRGGAGSHFKIRIRPDVSWEEIEDLVLAEGSNLLLATPQNPDDSSCSHDPLPLSPYYEMDYTKRHNFIVIGGETEGISSAAYSIASRTNGARVTIPLANGVESLNSVAAACVIMFEVKKQILMTRAMDPVSPIP